MISFDFGCLDIGCIELVNVCVPNWNVLYIFFADCKRWPKLAIISDRWYVVAVWIVNHFLNQFSFSTSSLLLFLHAFSPVFTAFSSTILLTRSRRRVPIVFWRWPTHSFINRLYKHCYSENSCTETARLSTTNFSFLFLKHTSVNAPQLEVGSLQSL